MRQGGAQPERREAVYVSAGIWNEVKYQLDKMFLPCSCEGEVSLNEQHKRAKQ